MEATREQLTSVRLRFVVASRVAGIGAPVDGVTTALRDDNELKDDCEHARRLGFGAKLCIHPAQLPVVNVAFSPSKGNSNGPRASSRHPG